MKKSLLLASALLGLSALNVSAALPKSDYPAGYVISPTPDSTVDVSGNKFPLGVSAISFNFNGLDVDKNPANTKPALLYWNDFTTPVATTTVSSIDMETLKSGGVIFPGAWNKNGEYKIEIPEGMFLAGGAPTGAMTLYYEISVGWYADPVDKMVVTELEDIVLHFPAASEVKLASTFDASFGTRTGTDYPFTTVVDGNRVIFKMVQDGGITAKFSTPGHYILHILAGGIEYVQNGQTKKTEEIRLTYFIPEAPEPSIYPWVDEVQEDGIQYFELTAPDGFTLMVIDDRAANNLYRADSEGNVDLTMPVAVAKVIRTECDTERNLIYLGLFDPYTLEPLNFELNKGTDSAPLTSDEWTVVPGTLDYWKPSVGGDFCLILAQGLYAGPYQSMIVGSAPDFVTSSPYRYYYQINGVLTDVEEIIAAPETETVDAYTYTGIRVLANAPKEALKNLPAGFYIVNGEKVIVK